MSRFQLLIFKQKKPKGKPLTTERYDLPMAARQSQAAKDAVYYEIRDLTDGRIIEIKHEVTNGHR